MKSVLAHAEVLAIPQTTKLDAGRSYWSDARRRLLKNRVAVVSMCIIGFYAILAAGCFLGLFFPHYNLTNEALSYAPPSFNSWLGNDYLGRDVLARAAQGTVTSFTIGIVGTSIAVTIGLILGAIAGYFGGWIDDLITWIYTTVDTIPYILLITAFSFSVGPGLYTLCWAIGLTTWVTMCRLVRGEVIKHRGQEYIQGAAAVGASHARRIFVHILPNIFHVVLIQSGIEFVAAIKSEVILTYLGLGVEPGTPSWGTLISYATQELPRGVWWGLGAATLFMFGLILPFNLFNDALRDVLDPKLKNGS